jgi:hypothetical protein
MKIPERAMRTWTEFADGLGSNVVLNTTGFHHIGLFPSYANAYREAANRLFKHHWQDGDCVNDMDLHPIIFLYRHTIELYLKGILLVGNDLLVITGKNPRPLAEVFGDGHELKPLLPRVHEIISLIDCSGIWATPQCESWADIERIVKAIDEFPHDAFRYPVDVKGEKENLPLSLRFNDFGFFEKSDSVAGVLEAATKRTQETFLKNLSAPCRS